MRDFSDGRCLLFRSETMDGFAKKQGSAVYHGRYASVPQGECFERKKPPVMTRVEPANLDTTMLKPRYIGRYCMRVLWIGRSFRVESRVANGDGLGEKSPCAISATSTGHVTSNDESGFNAR